MESRTCLLIISKPYIETEQKQTTEWNGIVENNVMLPVNNPLFTQPHHTSTIPRVSIIMTGTMYPRATDGE